MNPFTHEDLLKMKFTGNPALSPDGNKLLFEVTEVLEEENTYTTSVWIFGDNETVPFTNKGGQKTISDKHPQWSPDGCKVAFLSDRSDEVQIWVMTLGQGEAIQITEAPKGVASFSWAADSQTIYYLAKEQREEKKYREKATVRHITKLRYKFNGSGYLDQIPKQIFKVDIGSKNSVQLTHGEYDCGQPIPSPCGTYVAFSGNRSEDEQDLTSDIWLLDLNTKEINRLTNNNGRYGDPLWTPDGEHIISLGYDKYPNPGAYPNIWEISLENGDKQNLTANFNGLIGKSIGNDASSERGNTGLTLSSCGNTIYFPVTIGGSCYLQKMDRHSQEVEHIFGDGQMVISSYDIKNNHLSINLADPETPGDIWYGTLDAELERLTYFNAELFKDRYIAWPEPVHFTHPDGTSLEGWLLKPRGFEESDQYPVIMEIHGGPHTTYGNIFFHEFQMLTGNGFGVFYANPRGSMGYGEDFSQAVVGDWCGIDAEDLEFMAKEIRKIDWVDEGRLGVTGGSQGGYFTNWLISHTNIFSAAVTQRSMSNLYTKYGIADNGWNGDRYGMGGADLWDKEDFILERSPIRYAPQVDTPLLIIHSDMDFRCPLEQAEQWYVALKRLGNTTEMMIFQGENHNLSRTGKPANRLVRLEALLNWFEKYLD